MGLIPRMIELGVSRWFKKRYPNQSGCVIHRGVKPLLLTPA